MNITVQIPTALRRHTAGTPKVTCAAGSLTELFSVLDEMFPDLKPHLRDESGQVRRFLNVYVNEEDIRFLGSPSYAFQDGDEVLLVPSIAGGAPKKRAPKPRRSKRAQPESALPQGEIKWTKEQLESFGRLASGPPAPPNAALIDLLRNS